MGFFINKNGAYYEGDKASQVDTEVTQRPSPLHNWTGIDWVIDAVAEKTKMFQEKVRALEATITNRRLRESLLGTDGGWLARVDKEITELRNQLST
jgi:hypothetical protein